MRVLRTAKFRKNPNSSLFEAGGELLAEFAASADTQSFASFGGGYVFVHHQFHKTRLTPVTFTSGETLPDNDEIKFPTCVCSEGGLLAVAANGQDFKGSIRVYDQDLSRIAYLDLFDGQERPVGLAFSKHELLWSSYSGNKVWAWDWSANTVRLVVDVRYHGQVAPMGILPLGDQIAVLGHCDSSIAFYEFETGKLVRKLTKSLQNPWSITLCQGEFFISNLGDDLQNGFLLKLGDIGVLSKQPCDGATAILA